MTINSSLPQEARSARRPTRHEKDKLPGSTGQSRGAAGKDEKKPAAEKSKDATKDEAKAAIAAAPAKPEIELVKPTELVLGSVTDKSAGGYRIEVQLEQKGAGIYSVYSSRYDAEPEDNALGGMARKRPLRLIGYDPTLASLAGPDVEPGQAGAGRR